MAINSLSVYITNFIENESFMKAELVELNKNIKYIYLTNIVEDRHEINIPENNIEPGIYKLTLNGSEYGPNRVSSGINDSNILIFGMSIDQISRNDGSINGGAEITINL